MTSARWSPEGGYQSSAEYALADKKPDNAFINLLLPPSASTQYPHILTQGPGIQEHGVNPWRECQYRTTQPYDQIQLGQQTPV